ncbi:hypothetical protein HBO07_08020 [Pseudomonas proteolytica]|jgi:hypothetical protein|nr:MULTISPECIES: hypothetical protein [Pseudomonas]NMZ01324.1 hypothetical protein [Pseudomonas proteolytica]NMZ11227.1 hypothetical protein [Pseudomonas proteolytica]QJI20693.1 hypothetical protein HKK57_21260 [Pseudomonas sp. ADAK21]QJI24153.1 hypothetical protein HKK56_11830 [Pseudomonas sp. ADAK20]
MEVLQIGKNHEHLVILAKNQAPLATSDERLWRGFSDAIAPALSRKNVG